MTKRKRPEDKLKVGRPDKFKEQYCEDLIKHMEQGLSFRSFAGACRVSIQTIYDWADRYPQFLDAKKIGMGLSMIVWEKIGLKGAIGQIANFNATTYIYETSNRFPDHYRRNGDKIEVTNKNVEMSYEDYIKSLEEK